MLSQYYKDTHSWQSAIDLGPKIMSLAEELPAAEAMGLNLQLRQLMVELPAAVADDLVQNGGTRHRVALKLIATLELVDRIYPALDVAPVRVLVDELAERLSGSNFDEVVVKPVETPAPVDTEDGATPPPAAGSTEEPHPVTSASPFATPAPEAAPASATPAVPLSSVTPAPGQSPAPASASAPTPASMTAPVPPAAPISAPTPTPVSLPNSTVDLSPGPVPAPGSVAIPVSSNMPAPSSPFGATPTEATPAPQPPAIPGSVSVTIQPSVQESHVQPDSVQ